MIDGRNDESLDALLNSWGQAPFPPQYKSINTSGLEYILQLYRATIVNKRDQRPSMDQTQGIEVMSQPRYILWSQLPTSINRLMLLAYTNQEGRGIDRRRVLKFYDARPLVPNTDDRTEQSERFKRLIENLPVDVGSERGYRAIRYYHWGSVSYVRYVEMEFIEGQTLKQLQRKYSNNRMPYQEACMWMARTARAIHDYHQQGLYHFDIKPSNLMVDKHGCLIVIDMDSLRRDIDHRQGKDQTLTVPGEMSITASYAAPECTQGLYTKESDQYSLGVTLYNLISNSFPREPMARGLTPLTDVPTVLWQIIQKALAIEPTRRFESLETLAENLEGMATVKSRLWTMNKWNRSVNDKTLLDLHTALQRQELCDQMLSRNRKLAVALCSSSGAGASRLVEPAFDFLNLERHLSVPLRVSHHVYETPIIRVWANDYVSKLAILAAAYQYHTADSATLSVERIQQKAKSYAAIDGRVEGSFHSRESFEIAMQLVEALGVVEGNLIDSHSDLSETQSIGFKTASALPPQHALTFTRQILWNDVDDFNRLAELNLVVEGEYSVESFRRLYDEHLDPIVSCVLISEVEVAFHAQSLQQVLGSYLGNFIRQADLLDMPGVAGMQSNNSLSNALHCGHARVAGFLHARRQSYDQLVTVSNLDEELEDWVQNGFRKLWDMHSRDCDRFIPPQMVYNAGPNLKQLWSDKSKWDADWAQIEKRLGALGAELNQVLLSELRPQTTQLFDRLARRDFTQSVDRLKHLSNHLFETLSGVLDNEPLENLWYYLPMLIPNFSNSLSPNPTLMSMKNALQQCLDDIDRSNYMPTDHANRSALLDWASRLNQIARHGNTISLSQPTRHGKVDEQSKVTSKRFERAQAAIKAILDLTHVQLSPAVKWPQLSADPDLGLDEATEFIKQTLQAWANESLSRCRIHAWSLGFDDPDELHRVWTDFLEKTLLSDKATRQISELFFNIAAKGKTHGLRQLTIQIQNCLLPQFRGDTHISNFKSESTNQVYALSSGRIRVLLSFIRTVQHVARG